EDAFCAEPARWPLGNHVTTKHWPITIHQSTHCRNRLILTGSLLTVWQTVMSPFITITSDNKIVVTSEFWIFWAVAGPVTFLVVLLWVLWIQRRETTGLLLKHHSILSETDQSQ